jgi:hypothetical protein
VYLENFCFALILFLFFLLRFFPYFLFQFYFSLLTLQIIIYKLHILIHNFLEFIIFFQPINYIFLAIPKIIYQILLFNFLILSQTLLNLNTFYLLWEYDSRLPHLISKISSFLHINYPFNILSTSHLIPLIISLTNLINSNNSLTIYSITHSYIINFLTKSLNIKSFSLIHLFYRDFNSLNSQIPNFISLEPSLNSVTIH